MKASLKWGFVICSVLGFVALMITIVVAQRGGTTGSGL